MIDIYGAIVVMIVTVTDAEKFKQALVNGIGTTKAFGYGMIDFAKLIFKENTKNEQ
jgi:hypothetical protein